MEVIAFLRCLILMLFVVAGGTLESHCLPLKFDFDAICGVPEHLAILLFASMLDLDAICRGRMHF